MYEGSVLAAAAQGSNPTCGSAISHLSHFLSLFKPFLSNKAQKGQKNTHHHVVLLLADVIFKTLFGESFNNTPVCELKKKKFAENSKLRDWNVYEQCCRGAFKTVV